MSEENVEIVRRSYEAFDRGDIPAWLNGLDPEIVLHENADFPASPTFQGHEGMLRWIESVEEIWEEGRFHPETFRSTGDYVVASVRATGRGRGSGIPIDQRIYHVFRVRDGRVIEMWGYNAEAQALEAAGISE